MPESKVGICHRNRLFGECLAASLNKANALFCSVLSAEFVGRTSVDLGLELLVLDVSLADDLPHKLIAEIRQQHPTCKLLLLVAESAICSMVELARFNSQGCVFEEVPLAHIVSAIETVLAGRTFCSPELANALLAQIGRTDRDHSWTDHVDDVQLTAREREVLELIAWENLGNKQIARRLGVSLYTIKNHVHNLIEKLGVSDRHEAVQFARRRQLLFPADEIRAARRTV